MHPGLTKKKYLIQAPPSTFRPVLQAGGDSSSLEEEKEPLRTVTFKVKDRHVFYAKGVIGALVSVFGILVVFSILLVLAANKVESSVSPLGRSLKEGKLNKLVKEANKYKINMSVAEKPKNYGPIKVHGPSFRTLYNKVQTITILL